jgi:hypothetical protein
MNDDILKIVKMLLGIQDNDDYDDILEYLIEDCANAIKAYCHIDIIPNALISVIPRMVCDLWKHNKYGELESLPTVVTSETQGSQSVSYQVVSADDITSDYETRLMPYVKRTAYTPSQRTDYNV